MLGNEIPEGFKMTELGPLPDEWEVVRLGDVFDFSKKPRSLNIEHNDLIPFIPMEYIPDDGLYSGKYDLKRPEEIKSGSFFFKGDLLVAKITPSFENGKQCVVEELPTDFGYATTEVWPIHETDRTEILHLFYYLKRREIRTDIAGKMEGSTGRQRVPKNVLENFNIPLPSLPEQRAIAKVLSTVQDAKEKTDAVITATKELKKSLMKHLFTYGHVSLEEAEYVQLKETEIGMVPEGWGVKKIGSFAKFQGGYAFKSTDYQPEGVPVFKISNVSFGETVWNEKSYLPYSYLSEYSQFELKPGDLVMAMTRPIVSGGIKIAGLKDSDCPCLLNQRVGRFIVNQSVDTLFLFQILFDQSFISSISHGALGSQQPNISANKIEQISVPHPPLPIQQKIASILSAVDEKIEKEETKKKALEDLFKSLLNILMTGKLRVNHLEV